ncbi:MAG: hypothetical protein KGQ89_11165 [Verrucomicrobia bacterium]|nr:hypothetical protein [Verrucomicrobiota bacterium]
MVDAETALHEQVRNTPWSQVEDFARPGLKNDATESRIGFLEMQKLLEQRQPE